MPSHSARVRTAPLPAGYQFGDAAPYRREERQFYANRAAYAPLMSAEIPASRPLALTDVRAWRPLHLNAAEQLQRRAGWNVIEGGDH